MPKEERPVIQFDDGESNRLHAAWSRSGKRLILSIAPRGKWHEGGQVELDAGQAEQLKVFLAETLQP